MDFRRGDPFGLLEVDLKAYAKPRGPVGGRNLHHLRDEQRHDGPAILRLDAALKHSDGHLGAYGGDWNRRRYRSRCPRSWSQGALTRRMVPAGWPALADGQWPDHGRPL